MDSVTVQVVDEPAVRLPVAHNNEDSWAGVSRFKVTVCVIPSALALTSTVASVVISDAVKVNVASRLPGWTVTLGGVDTYELLTPIETMTPPMEAAELRLTVQVVDPGTTMVVERQSRALNIPVTARLTLAERLTPPALAVIVAVWFEVKEPAVAVNVALAAPAGTATDAGTGRDVLVLLMLTAIPPAGAPLVSAMVQVVEAPGAKAVGEQVSKESCAVPPSKVRVKLWMTPPSVAVT